MPKVLNQLDIDFQLDSLIVYLSLCSPCTKQWSLINKTLRPSGLRAEALANFFWPKGSFYFKIVRWFGALGTPHTIIALRSVIARFLCVVSRQPPSGTASFFQTLPFGQTNFALRATIQVFVVNWEILLYLSQEQFPGQQCVVQARNTLHNLFQCKCK